MIPFFESFRVDFDGYPGEIFFAHFDSGDEVLIQKLTRPREVTADGAMGWMPEGRHPISWCPPA